MIIRILREPAISRRRRENGTATHGAQERRRTSNMLSTKSFLFYADGIPDRFFLYAYNTTAHCCAMLDTHVERNETLAGLRQLQAYRGGICDEIAMISVLQRFLCCQSTACDHVT